MKGIVKILHPPTPPSQCLYVDRYARLPPKVVDLGKIACTAQPATRAKVIGYRCECCRTRGCACQRRIQGGYKTRRATLSALTVEGSRCR